MMRNLFLACVFTLVGSLPALGAAGTCPGENQIKSASTEINTKITFENLSGAARKIFWIDFSGARVHYGDIAPGATHEQPTFLGHAWLITDQNADCLGFYFAETAPRTVSLSNSDLAPTPPGAVPPLQGGTAGGSGPRDDATGDAGQPDGQGPLVDDGNPCNPGEYWNKSRNLCINPQTKKRRKPTAALPSASQSATRALRCRPGFVQSGSRCVRGASAATRPQPPRPQHPAQGNDPWKPGTLVADPDNEENRADDLCGPGFTDVGGGCISNSLLN
ncbi:hypothetical protein MNBD_ALPHA09-2259 [hydrothermal vent metagenome]|uniref:von Hippel-Lindau disease tumour suppressor beta domain-containing protein n=1 Tax=hydrothermal vent metagenome TaxID=652676 RepID=A0A3B0TE05_9ZZZZ